MRKYISRISAFIAAMAIAVLSVMSMTAFADDEEPTAEQPTVAEQSDHNITNIPFCEFKVTGGKDLALYSSSFNIYDYDLTAAPKEIITVSYTLKIPSIESVLMNVEGEAKEWFKYHSAENFDTDEFEKYGGSNYSLDAYARISKSYTKDDEDIEEEEIIDLGSYDSENHGSFRVQLPYEDLDDYSGYFRYSIVMHWNVHNQADDTDFHNCVGLSLRVTLDKDAPICDVVDIYASDQEGEDTGIVIDDSIVNGKRNTSKTEKAAAAAGGALAAGAAAGASSAKKKKRSVFKMHIYKEFGDVIEPEKVYSVYARITETLPSGEVRQRPDLTAQISPFSANGTLIVKDGGVNGDYRAAFVSIPKDSTAEEGMVSFQFKGEGGYFTENVIFKLTPPQIVFGQSNLGLPSHYEKNVQIWFGVKGVAGKPVVTAQFKDKKCPYKVDEPVPDKEVEGLWSVNIIDTDMKDEQEPGTTTAYRLHIKAVTDTSKAEGDFDVLRVFMGLSLQLEGNAVGCYLKYKNGAVKDPRPEDLEPCMTRGKFVLLCWNDEEQTIERVSVVPDKETAVKAVRVDNDKNSMIGDAQECHQQMVEKVGLRLFPTNEIDKDGSRTVQLTATTGGLDPPVRIRAEATFTAEFENKKYKVTKKLLLHSMPYRSAETNEAYSQMLKEDEHILERLMHIRSEIFSKYLNRLFSLYYFIDRMIDGYDVHFGYDPGQVARVMDIWTGFLRGDKEGANGDPVKLTLADELSACYAFMQGMRDNGGFLGRMALGICTAGYSEMLFFGMDLAEKMENTIMVEGKDMTFWDGVIMGVKEYEKQVAMELLIGGTLKAGNTIIGKATGIDLAKTATQNYRKFMDAADSSLKKSSKLYSGASDALENIKLFSNGGAASSAKNSIENSANADAAAKAKAKTTIAQRRKGDLGLSPEELKGIEISDLAMEKGMEKVRRLYEVQKKLGTARKAGNLAEVRAEYDKLWLEVKTDKNAFKALKRMNDPYAQTVRAEFTRVRKLHRQNIMEKVLDDVAEATGKRRADLYFESVTSNNAWKEDAGLTLGEDLDLTIREKCYSDSSKGMDVVIDQSIGENAVRNRLYKEFHNGAEPPTSQIAEEFANEVDVTYVSPWMDQSSKYVIEFNPEAYYDVKQLLNKNNHGDPLKGKALDRQTIAHKGKEWYSRGKKYEAKAAQIEANAAALTAAERSAAFKQAAELRYKANGCYVEGSRQIVKTANNIISPRAAIHEALTGTNPYTSKMREMVAAAEMTQSNLSPTEFFSYLKKECGMDFNQFADAVSKCLE